MSAGGQEHQYRKRCWSKKSVGKKEKSVKKNKSL